MPVTTPDVIPEPFATSGDRASIPDSTGSPGRASWSLGFPPDTMEAKIAGGIPPDGRDFNGVFYELSAHAFYTQAGQPFKYSSDISTAVSGYGLGAVLGSSDGATLWYNRLSGNTADPDGAGTNWVSAFTYGAITISGLTGGTRTLTRLESRFGLIVLTGALVANQAVVFPNDLANWRIVNQTTGSFTVTARTSAGTGVTIPQGDYSTSVGVYGNGTDIFLDVPPVSLPIAVTPDANTLAKRDNTGSIFAYYFNSSTVSEVVTVANVIVTNGSDGYYRKITLADFKLQLFASPALTGNPTAPTPIAGDSSTKIATTAFVAGLGVGGTAQTWHNVLSSRVINTPYTNTTGRPIMVNISVTGSAVGIVEMFVGGISVAQVDDASTTNVSIFPMSAIVPAGMTYSVQGGTGTIIKQWSELS